MGVDQMLFDIHGDIYIHTYIYIYGDMLWIYMGSMEYMYNIV